MKLPINHVMEVCNAVFGAGGWSFWCSPLSQWDFEIDAGNKRYIIALNGRSKWSVSHRGEPDKLADQLNADWEQPEDVTELDGGMVVGG